MNGTKQLGLFLATAMLTLGLAGTAAATPAECAFDRPYRGYVAGEMTGASIVNRAWSTVERDPDRLEEFTAAVVSALGTTASIIVTAGTDYADCRVKGFLAGAWNTMWEIQTDVIIECFMDGTLWGELVASLYCGLSQDLGGLALDVWYFRPPTNWCGIHFEAGCDGTANLVAENQCFDFTVGTFAPVWAEYRNNECTY